MRTVSREARVPSASLRLSVVIVELGLSSYRLSVRGVFALGILACALAPVTAAAQQIVKWTDANGQVHYSDHAPPDQKITTVNLPPAPKAPLPPPKPAPVAAAPQTPAHSLGWHDPMSAHPTPLEEDRKRREQMKKDFDKRIVDRCKARRETYCNRGPKGIEREESLRAARQRRDADLARHAELLRGGR